MSIPLREPDSITAGTTIAWRREDLTSDHPASGWTLRYELRNAAAAISIDAIADGDAFAVSVTPTASAGYAAGVYAWSAIVTETATGAKAEVSRGHMTVLPSLAAAGGQDVRSHARKVLDAIEAVIEGRATKDQMNYQIGDRQLGRTPIADLLLLRDRYRVEYQRELDAEAIARGLGGRRRILTRFSR